MRRRLGEILVNAAVVDQETLRAALDARAASRQRLGALLMFGRRASAGQIADALAEQHGLDRSTLEEFDRFEVVDPHLGESYNRGLILPLCSGDEVVVAVAEVDDPTVAQVRQRFGAAARVVVATKDDLVRAQTRHLGRAYVEAAANGLDRRDPENSALTGITRPQYAVMGAVATAGLAGLAVDPLATAVGANVALTVVLAIVFAFRLVCCVAGRGRGPFDVADEEVAALNNDDLPVYTILLPMLKEKRETVETIIESIENLDYPIDKLDVKLICEDNDHQTLGILRSLDLTPAFEIIEVPQNEPHTKGKACNYALRFARGAYFCIYDAEDLPERDQLKKALVVFAKSGERVACVQSHLNFYNARENWLTRMFTLDYTLWYDLMLPGMERLGLPICLGGTSNHFKTDIVRGLSAWDAYNVTEDADLGLRLAKYDYETVILNSTTLEEANTRVGNWVRQRSRWMKGYMMTHLVHMRHPVRLYRQLGARRFWGMQLFVGGNYLTNLINPWLWGVSVAYLACEATGRSALPDLLPGWSWHLAVVSAVVGNVTVIAFNMLAAARRGLWFLLPWCLTAPAYWALAAVATYKGAWQLFTRPFYWEKTEHGLSKVAAPGRAEPQPTFEPAPSLARVPAQPQAAHARVAAR